MKTEIKVYTIICDGCKKDICEGTEFCGFNDVEAACLDESEWITIEDNHYCPDCYHYDDNDNLVIPSRL